MSLRAQLIKDFLLTDPNLFFVYDAIDVRDFRYEVYTLRLYAVLTNGQKIFIDVKEPDVFFDIKLKDSLLIDSYLDEFKPASYEVINCQPFDSPYKHDFLHLYFENHNARRKVLQELKNRSDKLNNRLQEINDQKKKSYRVKTDIKK